MAVEMSESEQEDAVKAELAVIPQSDELSTWTPRMVISIDEAVENIEQKREFMRRVLSQVEGGLIPASTFGSTGGKDSLGKPGAEALLSAFGLQSELCDEEPAAMDYSGADHLNEQGEPEPFFQFRRRCIVRHRGTLIAQASGECNSWEIKYRYRNGERVCPTCGKPTIIKGRQEYGGGWICFGKKGGCSAKFANGDHSIEGQTVGRIKNPDPADQINTLLKMADKRALTAATIIATGFSALVTQDVEDFVDSDGMRIIDVTPRNAPSGDVVNKPAVFPQRPNPDALTQIKQPEANQKQTVINAIGALVNLDEKKVAQDILRHHGWKEGKSSDWVQSLDDGDERIGVMRTEMEAVIQAAGEAPTPPPPSTQQVPVTPGKKAPPKKTKSGKNCPECGSELDIVEWPHGDPRMECSDWRNCKYKAPAPQAPMTDNPYDPSDIGF